MIYSEKNNFAFIHIPKTGGTSVSEGYVKHQNLSDILLGGTLFGERIQDAYRTRFSLHKHSKVSELIKVVGERDFLDKYSFAIVRDPINLLFSAYKWGKNVNDPSSKLASLSKRVDSFEDFLPDAVTIFEPQVNYLKYKNEIVVNDILLFENLTNDWKKVQDKLGLVWGLPHKNVSKFNENLDLSEKALQIIYDVYSEDFTLIKKIQKMKEK